MAGIKEIRTRIASVINTQKITSAMKMVSAAKLRKAQMAVSQMKPYAAKLQELLHVIGSQSSDNETDNKYATVRPEEKILVVAIASNSGLCGGFNSNISKAVLPLIQKTYAGKDVTVYAFGKKMIEGLKTRQIIPEKKFIEIFDNFSFESVSEISTDIMNSFALEQFDKVVLVYNSFINAATQIVVEEQFLPIVAEPSEENSQSVAFEKDYIFEPTKEYIVQELIPRSLKIQFYSAMLDSIASEHGARMTAMYQATDNATDLLRDLRLDYNKARQASITNEILEIVSGANALG
ncbi:MAG: ATP synthase F1 subunit gamma [Bacteroidales bacterium]|jgi:F-type H+-transporting ATPase subunit gamma|nr:ATP synthase F1 subunit gamma [Bacteroidales bacterium]